MNDWANSFRADAEIMMRDMHLAVQKKQAEWLESSMAALPESDQPKAWIGYHPHKPLEWHLIVEGERRSTLKFVCTVDGKEIK